MFRFSGISQNVGINATGATPNSSAGLDVDFTGKGVLVPRVTLTITTSNSPVTSPATSLIVYNTATVNDVTPGYYYWDGAKWLRLINTGNNAGTEWLLAGNAGTNPPTDFIGTTDAKDFVMKTNGVERMRISSAGLAGINTSPAGAYLKISSSNASYDGMDAFHTSGSTTSAFNAVEGNVTNGAYTTATGYLGYHNTNNKTFSVYGNGGDLAGMFNGKVGVNSVSTALTSSDIEVRNNVAGANPVDVFLRQTTSNTLLNSILGNLDFGDDYNTSSQARIQVLRDAASSSSTDLPTAFAFSNMADGGNTLTERMRIANNGNVGINTTNPTMMLDVAGSSTTAGDAVIRGVSTGNGAVYGIKGSITSTTNTAAGVFGLASGTSGQIHGVLGQTYSTTGNSSGVRGYAGGATGTTFGVWGENNSTSSGATGVYGISTQSTGNVNGVWGDVSSTTAGASGVYATSSGGSGTYGMYAANTGNNGNGLYGECSVGAGAYGIWGKSTTGYAGYFNGNVHVAGTLSKSAGAFKIDHPLDPANKYLIHSFVESPDMMNVYNGNVITDENGEAIINLPSYFQAENIDYKYQLTVIGQFAQAIVLKEISDNHFTIKTDKSNVKVSWQVTGVRNDLYAQKNRIVNEVEKTGEERGKYIHPELYGLGYNMSIESLRGKKEQK
ncbi:MAG: hypothetical protein HY063_14640 [Bacteroidetes bacterium]|nr:hypothetical protein [Bacteroidota bacterium]